MFSDPLIADRTHVEPAAGALRKKDARDGEHGRDSHSEREQRPVARNEVGWS